MNKYRMFICVFLFVMPSNAFGQINLNELSGNSGLPIDIFADALIVKSEQNLAIFKGNVEATQGDMKLQADKMKVYYHNNEGEYRGENSLSKILTIGNTKLDTKTKKARSDDSIYDIDQSIITMTGNVVLVQDGSHLQGDKFWYDVKSGRSKLSSNNQNVQGQASQTKPKRVKGVFIPRKQEQK